MITLLYGAGVLVVLWWLSKTFATINPTALAKGIRIAGGVAALGVAALLGLRGRIEMAFLVGGAGAWLLGWNGLPIRGFGSRTAKQPGAVSRVRSAMIEMELDHDTGDMDGTVLAGARGGPDAREPVRARAEAAVRRVCRRRPRRGAPPRGVSRPPVCRLA
jgi:hypothetical protein